MKQLSLLACVAALVGVPALAAGQGVTEPAYQPDASFTLPEKVGEFATEFYSGTLREVTLGVLAQEKGQSEGVRRLGQTLVQDHNAIAQQLATLAPQNGWSLAEPKARTELDLALEQSEAALDRKLNALKGKAFDQAFLAATVEGHDLEIARVRQAQRKYGVSPLYETLRQAEPKLQQHRQKAYELLGQVSDRRPIG